MFKKITLWFHKMGSPPYFYTFAQRWQPWCLTLSITLAIIGLVWGLYFAPADYLQGNSFRIIYVHVPCAWMGQFIFAIMAITSAIGMIWRIKIAEIIAMANAPIGAIFTAIALITGSLWGRPTWGTFWVWDARLTSTLILLFLYFGVIGLYRAIEDPRKAARTAGFLAIIGLINLPIIRYSVDWWNTLHQPSSIQILQARSSIQLSMLWPLLIMAAATKFYYVTSVIGRAKNILLEQEGHKEWYKKANMQ